MSEETYYSDDNVTVTNEKLYINSIVYSFKQKEFVTERKTYQMKDITSYSYSTNEDNITVFFLAFMAVQGFIIIISKLFLVPKTEALYRVILALLGGIFTFTPYYLFRRKLSLTIRNLTGEFNVEQKGETKKVLKEKIRVLKSNDEEQMAEILKALDKALANKQAVSTEK